MNPVFAQDPTISDIGQYLTAFSIKSIYQFFPSVWGILLAFATLIAFVLLLIGGIQWITSGGDKEAMAVARGRITAALIGLIIVFSAWAIAGLLRNFFGFPSGGGGVAGRCTDQYGSPGETCNNLNKCDIAGGCNPACCVSASDCPSGQHCSIPNGYCKSGSSCSSYTEYHLDCVGDICVNVPGGGADKCTNDAECP